jgi:hypothetical protein
MGRKRIKTTKRVLYLTLIFSVLVPFWIVYKISFLNKEDYSDYGSPSPEQRSEGNREDNFCVAILTGYPEVARALYIRRLLSIIKHQVALPTRNLDLNVFCQGECAKKKISREFKGNFHNLNTLAREENTKQPNRMERYGQFLCKDGCDIQHEIKDSVVLEQDKSLIFNKNRWFFYRRTTRRCLIICS